MLDFREKGKMKDIFIHIPVFCLGALSLHVLPVPYNSLFGNLKNTTTSENVLAMLKIGFCLVAVGSAEGHLGLV